MRTSRAFTLTELLVALAIVGVLAGVLFPVIGAAISSANRTACSSNFRQVLEAHSLYTSDYDDRFVPSRYLPGLTANPSNDRKWPQLLLPYLRSFGTFQCPGDTTKRPEIESLFESDLFARDSDARFYLRAERTNLGYNALYLAPMTPQPNGLWTALTRVVSSLESTSTTIQIVDSVWMVSRGRPSGGGNYLVVPPCRYAKAVSVAGASIDTFDGVNPPEVQGDPTPTGWSLSTTSAGQTYGGAWPWHRGKMTVGLVDGSVRSMTPTQLSAGCQLKPYWEGRIFDATAYWWDVR